MIDIHSHILPVVDDGSGSEMESLLMLKAAIKEGIHTIVATPHYNDKYVNEKSQLLAKVGRLRRIVKENHLKIDVLPGQEIRIYGELLEDYEAGKLLTIANNSSYMLIEFPFRHVPRYAEKLLYDIQLYGIKPVIAHPERNLEFLNNPERLYNLVAKGALTQITTSSLTGYFGKSVQKFSNQLIEANLVHTIATDAHNIADRSFNMSHAYEKIMKKYGMDYVSYLKNNAHLIVEGKAVYREQPYPVAKKKFFGIF
jgi:protein-tyrosine phosphatase